MMRLWKLEQPFIAETSGPAKITDWNEYVDCAAIKLTNGFSISLDPSDIPALKEYLALVENNTNQL
jgi:hypothetical protein